MAALHVCVFLPSDSPSFMLSLTAVVPVNRQKKKIIRQGGERVPESSWEGVTLSVVFPVLSRDRLRSASHSVQCENVG